MTTATYLPVAWFDLSRSMMRSSHFKSLKKPKQKLDVSSCAQRSRDSTSIQISGGSTVRHKMITKAIWMRPTQTRKLPRLLFASRARAQIYIFITQLTNVTSRRPTAWRIRIFGRQLRRKWSVVWNKNKTKRKGYFHISAAKFVTFFRLNNLSRTRTRCEPVEFPCAKLTIDLLQINMN